MYALKITDDDDDFTNCTDNENEDSNIIFKNLLLSRTSSLLLPCLRGLKIRTMVKSF